MREASVAPSIVADMVGYLNSTGVEGDAVCAAAGIDPRTLSTRTTRISGKSMALLWSGALAASGDENLGMHATVGASPGALDIVGYAMLTSHTAEDALRRGGRLIRLLNDGLTLSISREGSRTRCHLSMLDTDDEFLRTDPRQVVETILIGIVHQLRMLTQREVIPLAVAMRHAKPAGGDAEHRRLFGIAPQFGASEDSIVIASSDLAHELRSANPALLTAFEAHADAALASLGASDHASIARRAGKEILASLKGEAPDIETVARALAMSPRTLQRGLSSEGTSFRALLDDARRELAVRHLADPQATVAKVAWLVGFAEPSAFHRAYRRWTGQSPRAAA
jgi:AraC-like DNA-binding protein